jgi:hypothetical protein
MFGLKGRGAVGALQWLFESPSGPDLEARFRQHVLGRAPKLASERRQKQDLFAWFIKELRVAGLESRGECPFNVAKMGYVIILERWLRDATTAPVLRSLEKFP